MNSGDSSSVNPHCLTDGAAEIYSPVKLFSMEKKRRVNRCVQKTYFTPILL
jgi:hypothetical protein